MNNALIIRFARSLGLLCCVLMIGACAPVRTFSVVPGEPSAHIEAMFDEGLLICIDGKISPIKKTKGYYEVPADKLVTLYTRRVLTRHLNSVNYCESSFSAIPKPQTNYMLNLKVRKLSCELEMLELDQNGKMVTVLAPAAVNLPCFYDDYFRTHFGDEYVN